jgi:hypothetical protein
MKETLQMNGPVLEIVEFRTTRDVGAFLEAARAIEPWLRARPGFRWRRLATSGGGVWLDCVEWDDMASAKAAAHEMMTEKSVAGFMATIDERSIIMRHADVAVSF